MHGTIGKLKCTASHAQDFPALPSFNPRWWYRSDRLDARPVIWSLKNRPEDWEQGEYPWLIRHHPTGHVFSMIPVRLVGPEDCSCVHRSNQGRFQLFQCFALERAIWRKLHPPRPPIDHEQFSAHFVY